MGYYIDITGSDFRIDAENKSDALEAIFELMGDPTVDRRGGNRHHRHFSWLNNATPGEWIALEDAMEDWRFPVVTDEDGNVIGIQFTGQKIGQENLLFERIAPYVENGSYIQFTGEDNHVWRIEFSEDDIEETKP